VGKIFFKEIVIKDILDRWQIPDEQKSVAIAIEKTPSSLTSQDESQEENKS